MALSGQRVTVLGAGRSGRSAAALALKMGAQVVLTDLREGLAPVAGVRCVFGRHDRADLEAADVVVVSPGIPARVSAVQTAVSAGAQVVGELGFAHRFLPADLPVVAVTGTNGKSTVTTFVGQLLAAAGRRVFVGGNLGVPLSEAVGQALDVAVVEVSSYQMELPGGFRASAAAILNLSPDHLERHGDMQGYAAAKARVFDRQQAHALAALPSDSQLLIDAAQGKPGRRAWLDRSPGVTLHGDHAELPKGRVGLSGLQLVGQVNRWNAAVASLLATEASQGPAALSPDELQLDRLKALPHRLELVVERDGVQWVNDSKATNLHSAQVGIRSMDRPAVVLLGGKAKAGSDYGQLAQALARHARAVICFGEAGDMIQAALPGQAAERVQTLSQAVGVAARLARPGDAVLLSPACSSFDHFENFEKRGELFSTLAREGAP